MNAQKGPNQFLELLRERKSIRRFTDKPVEPEKIEILSQALCISPTSRNLRPWEFIVVTDKAVMAKLAQSKIAGSAFLAEAALCVAVCADSARSDVWIEDCSIASILVQLAAQSVGLGSCWVQIRQRMHSEQVSSESYVREILHIPEEISVESIIGIGYSADATGSTRKYTVDTSKIHWEIY